MAGTTLRRRDTLKNKEVLNMAYYPEPAIDPLGDGHYETADCGHEVHVGGDTDCDERDEMYEWEDGTLCPECFDAKWAALSRNEKADALKVQHWPVEQPTNTWGCAG